ncbi:MAG: D-aminoacylase [Rhodospirillales bacterium]|nr:D-aminoacylase [Rhodospirillales bacterium]
MSIRYDVILRGGEVFDGSGAAGQRADIAIAGERIVAVGPLGSATAETEIDATNLAVAPGFIDVHTHDDQALLIAPDMAPKTSQGVTTVVVGNCGVSLSPAGFAKAPPPPFDLLGDGDWRRFPRVADYMTAVEKTRPAVNAAVLVGHATLRVHAMDRLDLAATGAEIDTMRARLRDALDDGAIGMSTGLAYAPASAAPTDEVVALADVLAAEGGIYTTHMRDEHDGVETSIDETIAIAKRSGARAVISHHKCGGIKNFGRSVQTLARIREAQQTLPLGLDAYPYAAASTILQERLVRTSSRVLISWSKSHPECAGRELADIARDWGVDPVDAAKRLQPAGGIFFMMDEGDVRRILAYPETMIGSDGLPHDRHPHPRLWGTFPRVLGHYARDLGILTLPDAIRRMTGLPASRFGLVDRGAIRVGAFADLTVFSPETVIDRASFEEPTRPASGIEHVLVNGRTVWRRGASTGERPGHVLRRTRR